MQWYVVVVLNLVMGVSFCIPFILEFAVAVKCIDLASLQEQFAFLF